MRRFLVLACCLFLACSAFAEEEQLYVYVTANQKTYRTGVTLTFRAHIDGGTPPFTLHWSVEESQTGSGLSELKLYRESFINDGKSEMITTYDRDVVFNYTVPAMGTQLFGMIFVTDANGLINGIDSMADVTSPYEWAAYYCEFVSYGNYRLIEKLCRTHFSTYKKLPIPTQSCSYLTCCLLETDTTS